MTSLDHAAAGDLLERYEQAWETVDGDAWTDLFSDDAEMHEDPFEPPLVGHNALRARLLEVARTEDQIDLTIERHWASGSTVLAAWHSSHVRRADRARVRLAGFMTLDIADDGRIARLREWWNRRDASAD
jgi:ketosteroid isomerase-like protein